MPESNLFKEISALRTEQINQETKNIDSISTKQILELINQQDALVHKAIATEIDKISVAVDHITQSFKSNGSLYYIGAGTSGRLGVVDASECPPTFGTSPEMVQGIIAGGREAMFQAQEGAEDKAEKGAEEIIKRNIQSLDVVCGIAASGRTPFVKGALQEANNRGCFTIIISTVSEEQLQALGIEVDIAICPDVGAEVIAGSTRMKSGTAQKLILNMLTTASMVKLGKTYGNVMVDLQLTNKKLEERAKKILMETTDVTYNEASKYLAESKGHVKSAIIMILANVSFETAQKMLKKTDGHIKQAIKEK